MDNTLEILRPGGFNMLSIATNSGEHYAKHGITPECTRFAVMNFVATFDDVTVAAEEGEDLYARCYQEDCEKRFPGHFAAIDINSRELHVGEFAESAIQKALDANPSCVVHLVQIGAPSAVSMGYLFAA